MDSQVDGWRLNCWTLFGETDWRGPDDCLIRDLPLGATLIILAKAGIQCPRPLDDFWIPAFAGMTAFFQTAASGI
jgi:hypothetical protein